MDDLSYTYCERLSATGNTWHLRPLTDTGLHPGGGIDSDSPPTAGTSTWR